MIPSRCVPLSGSQPAVPGFLISCWRKAPGCSRQSMSATRSKTRSRSTFCATRRTSRCRTPTSWPRRLRSSGSDRHSASPTVLFSRSRARQGTYLSALSAETLLSSPASRDCSSGGLLGRELEHEVRRKPSAVAPNGSRLLWPSLCPIGVTDTALRHPAFHRGRGLDVGVPVQRGVVAPTGIAVVPHVVIGLTDLSRHCRRIGLPVSP